MPKKRRTLIVAPKTCFVIMPFGGEFDHWFKHVYVHAIRDAGLEPVRADSISKPSLITEDIWRSIKQSPVLLADLTGLNPNVFYELGLAHGTQKPAVLITDNIEDVPFDLRSLRLLVRNAVAPKEQLRRQIAVALWDTLSDRIGSLPIAFAQPKRGFEKRYPFGGRSVETPELERIERVLKEVPAEHVDRTIKKVLGRLSKMGREQLLGEILWESSMTKFANPEVVEGVRQRLATLGENFPLSLLAEVVYYAKTAGGQMAVRTLVETGFARDFIEANIIFEMVEWGTYEVRRAKGAAES
jgi:hypothetical protein